MAEAGGRCNMDDGLEMETIFGDGSSRRAVSWVRWSAPESA